MSKKETVGVCILLLAMVALQPVRTGDVRQCSVLVYGSTPAGLCAAIAAARHFKGTSHTVCLLSVHTHVGGMVTGGLGKTDTGGPRGEALIGGIAQEFFTEVGRLYGKSQPVYVFEPSIASKAFDNLLSDANVTVDSSQELVSVAVEFDSSSGNRYIVNMTTTLGVVFSSDVFIDATYEGDLLAAAGINYTIGREGVHLFNESLAGRQLYSPSNQFYAAVDPINVTTGRPLPLVSPDDSSTLPGDADNKVSAYNLRLCLTRNTSNKVDIKAPEEYDPEVWELARRYAQSSIVLANPGIYHFLGIGSLPNEKSDTNNAGPMSTDFIGASFNYPNANWTERKQIIYSHYLYTHQLLWFLGHDPSIHATIRSQMQEYGLCADEYAENEWYQPHWPPQLYVREARRMVGPYVFTQNSAEGVNSTKRGNDSIGCGAYNFDSHNVQRYPCMPGSIACTKSSHGRVNPCCKHAGAGHSEQFAVIDEGDVEINPGPFEIPYDVLLPSINESSNLLVPGAVSASHVGFSCLRLEPQWMIMGHSAGTAAAMAVMSKVSVQEIDRAALHAELLTQKQILSASKDPL